MSVHPSAIVEAGASLGPGVQVGPFSFVGSEVVIGDQSIIQTHVVLEGRVVVGKNNSIGHGSIIGGLPQDAGFDPGTRSGVELGNGNVIREHCTIHRGTTDGSATRLGDGNFLMAGAHLGHDVQVGNEVVIANNCLLGGHVRIGDRAFLGGGTVFHQFTRVGRLVMTQGNSGFGKDIPPFVVAAQRNVIAGLNVVGMRRAGFSVAERSEIKRAFQLLYRSGLNRRQVLDRVADTDWGPLGREFFDFVAQTGKRGLVPYRRGADAEAAD